MEKGKEKEKEGREMKLITHVYNFYAVPFQRQHLGV